MKPVSQREIYIPDKQTGDCWKCCLASIFELPYEDVPHFVAQEERGEIKSYWNASLKWVNERGFTFARFDLWGNERPFLKWGSREIEYAFHSPGYWIAGVISPRKTPDGENLSHVVVMSGDKIVFDPHPLRKAGHLGFTEAFLLVKA